jgi:phosphoribosyl 1,2-cyclic phosphodiesterase
VGHLLFRVKKCVELASGKLSPEFYPLRCQLFICQQPKAAQNSVGIHPRFNDETRYSFSMVRVTVLGSGSKGNCTVVSTSRTRIVLDAGLSCREIVKRMRFCGEDPEKLDAVLITHEHQDHVQGLSVLARRWNVPVYATQATHAAWRAWITPRTTISLNQWLELRRQQYAESMKAGVYGENDPAAGSRPSDSSVEIPSLAAAEERHDAPERAPDAIAAQQSEESHSHSDAALPDPEELIPPGDPACSDPAYLPCIEHFRAGISFDIGDIHVTPFTIPHDAADPVGFVVQAEGMRVVIATDLGYLAPNVRMHLRGADLLMIESNHDVEMLRDGPYPWIVKQRVLSRVGHLSNDALGEYLSSEYDGGARYVILAHISESNNLPVLARSCAERALNGRMGLLANRVLLASQNEPLESIDL